jgi:5-methylcytosine-specific restriction endonuclease McrA
MKKNCTKCGRLIGKTEHVCPTSVWNKGKKGLQSAWNKGKPMSVETRKKLSVSKTGQKVSNLSGEKNGMYGKTPWNKGVVTGKPSWISGKKMPKEWRDKISGEKHYRWNGGTSSINLRIRKSYEYREWRSDVFSRDDFTCQECFIRGGNLEAHHIKPFSIIINENKIESIEDAIGCSELWNINNGLTLCKECHKKTDTYLKGILTNISL